MTDRFWDVFLASIPGILALVMGLASLWTARKERDARNRNLDIDSVQKLSAVVGTLSDDLEEERNARKADRDRFKKEIEELRSYYETEMNNLKQRVADLERERNELLVENRNLRKLIGE